MELAGRRLGEFEVLERFAAGGFGEVFRARQTTLQRDAVIKVMASTITGTARERFTREAQLASQLDHPYAAHIYAFGVESDGLQWIAMELVRGISLAELLAAQGPLSVARFVPLFTAICQVVQVAHEQGIVHRDLKPANVMIVARAGVLLPKLLDFGIARLYTADAAPMAVSDGSDDEDELEALLGSRLAQIPSTPRDRVDLTSGGMYLGSPPYMAPELWLRPHAAGPPCDIYALGVLAFECLTGRQPYTGETLRDVARAHLGALPALGNAAPAALHGVLAKAVEKKAKQRFPDALALARAVEAACRPAAFESLPRPPSDLIAGVLAHAPQPVAEAVAAAEASTRADDACARYGVVGDVLAQYVGVLAFASWCRLGRPQRDERVSELARALARTGLDGPAWLELAAAVTRPFARLRDAFPVPELVDLCHPRDGGPPPSDDLRALLATATGARDVAHLASIVGVVGRALGAAGELFAYPLAVRGERGCERWSGPRRRPRPLLDGVADGADGTPLREGEPLLLDGNRAPVLSLWPLAKAIAPTASADPELFLVAGRGRYGARLVAHPFGFERQDPELAGWLDELAGTANSGDGDGEDARAPYRGLASFSVDDSALFFGRERESENLANHLRTRAFAAVVGPSGAGKSSYVQAGVLPLLPKDWRAVVVRPGATPLAALYARLEPLALAPLPDGDRRKPAAIRAWLEREARRRGETIVIYVDQSEELVTLTRDDDDRSAFAQLVAGVRDDERVRVVMTMRDDFLMRLQRLPGLGERLTSGIHLLGTPSRADLRRILVEPARRMGYELEDARLADEMVDAVADNPSALALLSFTAARLWDLRDRQFKVLRRKVYASIGGVGGALAQHAEDVIVQMSADERALVREAFRHLVTADGTRAVIAKSELLELLGGSDAAARVIERLVDARLAVTAEASGGITVEVTHEALLESWPRLVQWRREDAEHARLRDQLRTSAKQWEARERDRGLLWRGDVLVEYRLWRARYHGRLSELEEAFAAACLREETRGLRRRRVLLSAAFAALVATAVVLYLFAARARTSAREATQKTFALLEEQGRRELLEHHPLRAAVPLARAYALGGDAPSLRFLLARAMASVDSQGPVLTGHRGVVRHAYFSPDGARVITAGDDGSVRAWDGASGAELAHVDLHAPLRVARTHDGELIAAATSDELRVLRARDLSVVARWPIAPAIKPVAVAIADGGSRIVIGDFDGNVHVLADAGARHDVTARHKGLVPGVAISRDGAVWATGGNDGHVFVASADGVRDLAAGAGISCLAIADDGATVAAGARDGKITLWSTHTGELVRALTGHAGAVRSVDITHDGKRLVSASEDGTIRVWNAVNDTPPLVLSGHENAVFAAVFDATGQRIASAGADGTVRVWDATSGATLDALDAHTAEAWDAAFDPAGARVASAGFDQTARVWNLPHRDQRIALPADVGGFSGASLDRAGDRVATGGSEGVAHVFAITGELVATLPLGKDPVRAIALSPDGTLVACGGEDGRGLLARVADPAHPIALSADGGLLAARFSPDGRQLVVGGGDGVARVLDDRGQVVRRLTGHTAAIWGVAYSADGARIATASDDRSVRIWDAATGALVLALAPATAEVNAVAFSRDGARLAAASQDGTLRVYRSGDGALLASTTAHHDNVYGLAWSRDGERLVTSSADRTAVVWDSTSLRELAAIVHHGDAVYGVAFQGESDRLLTAGGDGALWLVDLGLEDRPREELSRRLDLGK